MAELLFLARAHAGGLARDVGPVCLIDALEEEAADVTVVPTDWRSHVHVNIPRPGCN